MTRLMINLIIEGNEEDIHEIKGKIIGVASEAIVKLDTSYTTSTDKREKKEIDFMRF